jgi:Tfp pilus assembly ATPase PilU
MMAVLDQKSIRNGYKPVANSNSDAELYSANADRMNKIKAAYNKKVESKILAVVRPGMTPAEVTGHVTRIMKEEQERYFKALEKEREDIMITRYRELFVAAAFAAGIGMLMDYLFNLIPGPDGVDPPQLLHLFRRHHLKISKISLVTTQLTNKFSILILH